MGFVDGKQRQRRVVQQLDGTRLNQPFRCAIQQVQLAGHQGIFGGPGLLEIHGGVQERRFNAQLFQGGHLVLHQGDQRRDDHRRTRSNQGRHLITQGLTAAGGHQYQGITTAHHFLHDIALQRPETFVTEYLVQNLLRASAGGRRGFAGQLVKILVRIHAGLCLWAGNVQGGDDNRSAGGIG